MKTVIYTLRLADGRTLTGRGVFASNKTTSDIVYEGAVDAIPDAEFSRTVNIHGLRFAFESYTRMTGGELEVEKSGEFDFMFDDTPPGWRSERL